LRFVYLLLNLFLCLNQLFWTDNNSLNVACNQDSILNNIYLIPLEEVTEFLNNLGVPKLLYVWGPIFEVLLKVFPQLRVSKGMPSVI
jgi:hypothetical protein